VEENGKAKHRLCSACQESWNRKEDTFAHVNDSWSSGIDICCSEAVELQTETEHMFASVGGSGSRVSSQLSERNERIESSSHHLTASHLPPVSMTVILSSRNFTRHATHHHHADILVTNMEQ